MLVGDEEQRLVSKYLFERYCNLSIVDRAIIRGVQIPENSVEEGENVVENVEDICLQQEDLRSVTLIELAFKYL